jgi:hypothetical protein
MGRETIFSEPQAGRGEGKRRTFRLSRATRKFCKCGFPQPSGHFEHTLQGCGSGQKLQSQAWGAPHISLSRGQSEGKASEEADGLDRILQAELHHLAKTFPDKSISIAQGHTELLHV